MTLKGYRSEPDGDGYSMELESNRVPSNDVIGSHGVRVAALIFSMFVALWLLRG